MDATELIDELIELTQKHKDEGKSLQLLADEELNYRTNKKQLEYFGMHRAPKPLRRFLYSGNQKTNRKLKRQTLLYF